MVGMVVWCRSLIWLALGTVHIYHILNYSGTVFPIKNRTSKRKNREIVLQVNCVMCHFQISCYILFPFSSFFILFVSFTTPTTPDAPLCRLLHMSRTLAGINCHMNKSFIYTFYIRRSGEWKWEEFQRTLKPTQSMWPCTTCTILSVVCLSNVCGTQYDDDLSTGRIYSNFCVILSRNKYNIIQHMRVSVSVCRPHATIF